MQAPFAWRQLVRLSSGKAVLAGLFASVLAARASRADIYLVDGDNVNRFNASTGAVVQTNGQNTFTTLSSPTGIAAGSDGLIYLATSDPSNTGGPVVNRYNATTGAQVGGPFVAYTNGPAQVSNAAGIGFGPDGKFYIADEGDNGPVKAFTSDGTYFDTYSAQGGNAQAVAFNPASPGSVYVATGSTVERIDLTSHASTIVVQGSSETFNNGSDLAFGPDGKLYVLDISSADPQILRYNADGTGQSVFVDFNSAEFALKIFQPADFAFGPNGDLFVSGADFNDPSAQQGEILELSSDGMSFSDFVTGLDNPGFLTFNAVPEPASLAIFAAIGPVFLRRRKAKR